MSRIDAAASVGARLRLRWWVPPRRTNAPAPLEDSIGKVPRGAAVHDRESYLIALARGHSVVHLGFVDARNMREKVERSAWLHAKLASSAGRLVGIDADPNGVAVARQLGYEAYVADCQSAESVAGLGATPVELVVAGELIEHLDRPGEFLEAVRPLIAPGGGLVITTPNATSLTNALLGLMSREAQNSDHVGWYSWRTLETLLARHGYNVVETAFYRHPRFVPSAGAPRRTRVRCAAFNLYESVIWPVLAIAPSLADGIIVTAVSER
jgi:hypothetical protein